MMAIIAKNDDFNYDLADFLFGYSV
ncbi:hypothetical protein GNP81_04930 [Aliivibrio fischeri]|uniref:Uncharacterized protein n=2 Tax=Aliivibrio fischeri TaxID=668 RepID=B1WN32_ALIF1|nr:hypothetical protein VF_2624 [Aliivibrio fischeri ES114]MUH98415.1 hypothetical protein [Aliivibrio fischeri]MUI55988.1 hypothetical protein [Aliivibrio fischeri]MUI64712.1 hypothetical protein [Aliivibrio fischeri]MUJ21437.1 hypothetical protein [Aliivibrio fischeri]